MKGYGKFFDGQKPFSIPVYYFLANELLYINSTQDKISLAIWPVSKILLDDDQSTVKVIKCKNGNERLEIEFEEIPMLLSQNKFKLKIPNRMALASITLALILIFSLIWLSLPSFSMKIAQMIPIEEEKSWAEKFDLDKLKEWKYCNPTQEARAAIDKIILRIYPLTTDSKLPIQIDVIDSPIMNAFSLPGGKIVIMNGLIAKAATPEVLAGVIAHEIEHQRKRHVTAMLIRSSFLTAVFHFISGDFSSVFVVDPSTAMSIATLTFNREMEEEADLGAMVRLKQARINPQHFAKLFEHTLKLPPYLIFLSDHPSDKKRIEMAILSKTEEGPAIINEKEWELVKMFCKK